MQVYVIYFPVDCAVSLISFPRILCPTTKMYCPFQNMRCGTAPAKTTIDMLFYFFWNNYIVVFDVQQHVAVNTCISCSLHIYNNVWNMFMTACNVRGIRRMQDPCKLVIFRELNFGPRIPCWSIRWFLCKLLRQTTCLPPTTHLVSSCRWWTPKLYPSGWEAPYRLAASPALRSQCIFSS